jgi:hypothetical protein
MKTKAEIEARILQLSLQLAAEMEEIPWEGEYGSLLAAVEARAVEIGDRLTREVATQLARMATEKRPPDSECCCPKCNDPGNLNWCHARMALPVVVRIFERIKVLLTPQKDFEILWLSCEKFN